MKIRILSDLHLECYPFTIPELDGDAETVLVLAGDIAPFKRRTLLAPFLADAAKQFRAVCFVPGNHEYYGSLWPKSLGKLSSWGLPENIHVMDRSIVKIDDVTFVGATLWTDMENGSPFALYDASLMMSDFRAIRVPGNRPDSYPTLTPAMTVSDHKKSLAWFEKELSYLDRAGKKAVMISHHGLTPQSIHPRFRNNALNGAFVSDLTHLLEMYQPALAIHGHTHDSFDYRIGETRVVVNPRGYVSSTESVENTQFDPLLTITI